MAKACRVCVDRRREEIDRELASGRSVPQISREYDLPESNMYRHRKDHMTITRSITESRPAGIVATVEHLQALDQQLSEVQSMAMLRGHTQACVAALSQRIKIATEISALRDEIRPQEKRVVHVHLDADQAERIARSYMRHQQISGESGGALVQST